jgi:hypothetical protein
LGFGLAGPVIAALLFKRLDYILNMVALHNRRLTQRDIWPNLPWESGQWEDKQIEFYSAFRSAGMSHPEAYFSACRARDEYFQNAGPSFGTRQQIMKRIYPGRTAQEGMPLSREEIEYLIERLEGVNNPVGLSAMQKLSSMAR